ncbi:MAG: hypothetical protein KKI07_02940 [Euryarchaeota archaeon]|nr:hypothetical protein [Euryarchaeota archaeon]
MDEKYRKFKKFDKEEYVEVTRFLKERTHLTAREWAIARLCADFQRSGRAEMTRIGTHLPKLVPFMNEPYSRQAVSRARAAFKRKVLKSGATFFYAYYSGLISMEEIIDMIHQIAEDIDYLLNVGEGRVPEGDVDVEVQQKVADVLRQITNALGK